MMLRIPTLAGSAIVIGLTSVAEAGANKTWVSGTGVDSGTCAFTAPCATFQYAHDQTNAGGEIDVKDTGGFGTLKVTKAISVVAAEGVLATINVPASGTGIAVGAGSQDKVVLQGLSIDGHGIGSDGIDFNSGFSLTVEHCHIRNVTNIGISLQPVGAQIYNVSDTEVANAQNYGILLQPFNSSPSGSFSAIYLHDNATGLFVGYVTTIVTGSMITANQTGIGTEIGANILLGQTTVSGNTTYGIQTQGGTVSSYGDSYINGNATDISGSFGSISKR